LNLCKVISPGLVSQRAFQNGSQRVLRYAEEFLSQRPIRAYVEVALEDTMMVQPKSPVAHVRKLFEMPFDIGRAVQVELSWTRSLKAAWFAVW
jgi:hypothetical protein